MRSYFKIIKPPNPSKIPLRYSHLVQLLLLGFCIEDAAQMEVWEKGKGQNPLMDGNISPCLSPPLSPQLTYEAEVCA